MFAEHLHPSSSVEVICLHVSVVSLQGLALKQMQYFSGPNVRQQVASASCD